MEAELLPARVRDCVSGCERSQVPRFLGFLNETEVSVAINTLKSLGAVKYEFFGGYDGAERLMLGIFPEWCETPQFPIEPLSFCFRKQDSLAHRDFLGALMALGISRESVGDILIEDGRAVVFLARDILGFVESQMDKIGRVGVTITKGFSPPLPNASRLESFTVTVASNRLDCVVGALAGVSRGGAADMLEAKTVFLNAVCVEKPTRAVCSGDKISIRGKGRFQIESIEEKTKKGRTLLKYNKYV